MDKLLLSAIVVALALPASGCDDNTASPSTTRCLTTSSPVARTGFIVVAADGTTMVYDFDSLSSAAESYANVATGYGTVEVTTGCSNLRIQGGTGAVTTVAMTMRLRGTAPGIYDWEGGSGSRSGVRLTISGGPHGGSYVPVSGSTEVQEITLGTVSVIKARFCGTIEGLNGKPLIIRGGRVLVR